jgi:hypothetical protein
MLRAGRNAADFFNSIAQERTRWDGARIAFRFFGKRLRQRSRILAGLVKRPQHATVRHGNRIAEGARPSHQVERQSNFECIVR